MRIYYLEIFPKEIQYHKSEIYSSLEKAIEKAKQCIQVDIKHREANGINEECYSFTVTEIENLEYVENFDVFYTDIEEYWKNEIKPTHKVYFYNKNGELQKISIQYRPRTGGFREITMHPNDFLKDAGSKFKVGDIVYVNRTDINLRNSDIGIIKEVPKKENGQPYFFNYYKVVFINNDNLVKEGIVIREYHEKDINKEDETTIKKESPIKVLQRIIKAELQISQKLWRDIVDGKISFDTRVNYKYIEELYCKEKSINNHIIDNRIKAKIIGIGNAGNSIIREIAKFNINKNIEYQNINTDMSTFSNYKREIPSFIIGKKIAKGLGCFSNSELGEKVVKESREEIIEFLKKELQDIDIVFLVTGLGGGVGTGATPLIADIIRCNFKKLVIAVVTIPFYFEGRKRFQKAMNGLENIKQNVDILIVYSNDSFLNKNYRITEVFKECDRRVSNIVQELYEAINKSDIEELNKKSLQQIILGKGNYLTFIGSS